MLFWALYLSVAVLVPCYRSLGERPPMAYWLCFGVLMALDALLPFLRAVPGNLPARIVLCWWLQSEHYRGAVWALAQLRNNPQLALLMEKAGPLLRLAEAR
jgi:hypothetical protein